MDFDKASETYDYDFNDSLTGKAQRERVWHFIDKKINTDTSLHILEINCGTGIDAAHLASFGHKILATDISQGMINVARSNVLKLGFGEHIEVQQLDINELAIFQPKQKFDLIFSNFGGLNCISPMQMSQFFKDSRKLLKKAGQLHLVIMPSFCIWETVYFTSRMRGKDILRRRKKAIANVSGQNVPTWYFSPAKIRDLSEHSFCVKALKPIGLFTFPSYMEHIATKYLWMHKSLRFFEKALSNYSWQAYISDHYYLELELK